MSELRRIYLVHDDNLDVMFAYGTELPALRHAVREGLEATEIKVGGIEGIRWQVDAARAKRARANTPQAADGGADDA